MLPVALPRNAMNGAAPIALFVDPGERRGFHPALLARFGARVDSVRHWFAVEVSHGLPFSVY